MTCIRLDWVANRHNCKAHLILTFFRIVHFIAIRKNTFLLLWIAGFPIIIFYKVLVEWLLGTELVPITKIGPGLRLFHGQAIVVHRNTVIGHSCTLRNSTTIGARPLSSGEDFGTPIIGNSVDIGSNAVIIGPITVGDGAIIGAGTVVVKDIPPNAVVVGNPARVIRIVDHGACPARS